MEIKSLFVGGRSATLQLGSRGLYELPAPVPMKLNGKTLPPARTVVTSLYGLQPDTDYLLEAETEEGTVTMTLHTEAEVCTMDVRRFGAVGNGAHDDTAAIQAAILSCPVHGRVLIPAGTWKVLPLFLKSGIRLELARRAVLKLETDRKLFPILPGMTLTTDGRDDVNLGTWEGNPLDCYGSLLTGIGVQDCVIYGEGTLDGSGPEGDWWINEKVRRGAWRGNLMYLNGCSDVTVQGVTFTNSPSWNLHPYFSDGLKFLNLTILAPAVSPNTDGFDPESCSDILMAGTHFSVGDDCIAVKSGKLYMGRRYKRPCIDMEVSHCLMENGHGGVTIGSEMAGGARRIRIHDCLMRNTDRGFRLKTRRGRGQDGVLDNITIENVRMDQVLAPFVANSLYYCDPDGHSPYVQSTECQKVDETTPRIGRLCFKNIEADGAACAGYFLGLPELPIKEIVMENVRVACSPDAKAIQPVMADCVGKMTRTGVVMRNVASYTLKDVEISGCEGEKVLILKDGAEKGE